MTLDKRQISFYIANIDKVIKRQLHQVMNNLAFKNLRASWVGIHYLIAQSESDKTIVLKLLNVSWCELRDDSYRAADFLQSQLFDKLYNAEFDMAGGEPFNLLLGDYEIDINPVSNKHAFINLVALKILAQVASASFCIFVSSINASAFGYESYTQFSGHTNLKVDIGGHHQKAWMDLRNSDSAAFLGFTLPKVLLNSYYDQSVNQQRKYYDEQMLIWSNATYAYAALVINSFRETAWFFNAFGIPSEDEFLQRGILSNLEAPKFPHLEHYAIASRILTETAITSEQERALSEAGFISVCHLHNTDKAVVLTSPSLKSHDTLSLRQSVNSFVTQLPYILCVCRFAHFIKILARAQIGSYKRVEDCEQILQNWIGKYVASNTDMSIEMKYRYPLRAAKIKMNLKKGSQKQYICVMDICPHLRTTNVSANMVLKTHIADVS